MRYILVFGFSADASSFTANTTISGIPIFTYVIHHRNENTVKRYGRHSSSPSSIQEKTRKRSRRVIAANEFVTDAYVCMRTCKPCMLGASGDGTGSFLNMVLLQFVIHIRFTYRGWVWFSFANSTWTHSCIFLHMLTVYVYFMSLLFEVLVSCCGCDVWKTSSILFLLVPYCTFFLNHDFSLYAGSVPFQPI